MRDNHDAHLNALLQGHLNGLRFERAREDFHRAYHTAYTAHPPLDRGEQAHDEATTEALLAFLETYQNAA